MAALDHDHQHFTRLLIANRGEIARRIIRTCQQMGIETVAVYSDPDRYASHVKEADYAIHLPGYSLGETYLNIEAILQIAQSQHVQAIHPGYGFLSENASFARACIAEDIVFIGPHPGAIEGMGSKQFAKELIEGEGLPVVPGYHGDNQDTAFLAQEAAKIGYPIMIKAAAGGGGKGMRIVDEAGDFANSLTAVKSEARTAFGNDRVILEKYIRQARHVEVQILGDRHGHLIHLGERECSLQRRFQKIIEETPAPNLSAGLRNKICDTALRIGRLLDYDNAGTVEFILDDTSGEFYFLEVNTRLQVEHPVTEMVTGLDLVRLQIEVTRGMPLPIAQEDVRFNGHAIEARLYAEDPANGFVPETGTVELLSLADVDHVRYDLGIHRGSVVTVHFDPMLGKVIAWGNDRTASLNKLTYALRHLRLLGVGTNIPFLINLLTDATVRDGKLSTTYVDNHLEDLTKVKNKPATDLAVLSAFLLDWMKRQESRTLLRHLPSGWRNNPYQPQEVTYRTGENTVTVKYTFDGNRCTASVDNNEYMLSAWAVDEGILYFDVDGRRMKVWFARADQRIFLASNDFHAVEMMAVDPFAKRSTASSATDYTAPMPSQIVEVRVAAGDSVDKGQALVVLSSMKMESTVTASEAGVIEQVLVKAGDHVKKGAELVRLQRPLIDEESTQKQEAL